MWFRKQKLLSRLIPRRGMTLVEVSVAMLVATMVMAGVASLQWISARGASEMYGITRTRSSRMQALDQIRFRLCNARIGTVSLSQSSANGPGFNRVEFNDPNLGAVTSAFYFVSDQNALFYDDDINDNTAAVEFVRGPINISFESQSSGAIIVLYVRSSSDLAYAEQDIQDGETVIYLRNS